jgi:outer membrane immunogenic protein
MKNLNCFGARSVGSVLFSLCLVMLSSNVKAEGILQDFDTLGGNDVLLDRAKALNPEVRIQVVQDRIVGRRNRVEVAPDFGFVLGGDPYNSTQNMGLALHYHITPQWSLGARYNYSANKLRAEGEYIIKDMSATGSGQIPDIDYPKSQAMAVLNWYPIYGKMNMYDLGVSHFDVYATFGAGQIELKSGKAPTYTAGVGVGLWVSQHITTRLEMRWQRYKASRYTGPVEMDMTVAGLQVGYLF